MSDVVEKPWRWKPGETGNPAGGPKGSRSAFSAAFIGDLTASWHQHGASVLEQVARRDPSRYLGIASTLIPKDVQARSSALNEQDLAIFNAIRQAIPNANDRPADEILNYTLEALRAHGSKLVIEGE